MFSFKPAFASALVAIALGAAAQTQPAVPAFRSALESYRPFADQEVAPWTRTNETVRTVGGWRAYAQEGREEVAKPAAPAAPAASAPASAPAQHKH